MNLRHRLIAAVVLLALWAAPSPGAASEETRGAPPAGERVYGLVFGDWWARSQNQPNEVRGQSDDDAYPIVLRGGYWSIHHEGSPVKTGEFQSLSSSPFWDADGLLSDGSRTLDFFATGTDQDGNKAGLTYYGPGLSAKVDYDRYLRRLDRDQFLNFDPNEPVSPTSQRVLNRTVLHAGEDYAIRVQDFDARFKGHLADNLKWRLNVWGIQREGERQAQKLAHCFNESLLTPGAPTGNRCHILAQPQRIDWTTVEIEPVIEANLDYFTVEYSRTMRALDQNDQVVTRQYTNASHTGWPVAFTAVPYNFTTENYTEIDRIKVGADITDYTKFYGLAFVGNTQNEFRGTHRYFNGFDLRLTNEALDGVTVTGYGKRINEHNRLPTTFPENDLVQGGDSIADYHHPVNYEKTAAGVKGKWRPSESGWNTPRGLSFNGGYEYALIDRAFAEYDIEDSGDRTFVQPNTRIHEFQAGTAMRWSACWDTYLRYRLRLIDDPIFGVRATNGDLNTNQPEQAHLIEIGGTWMPAENFLVTATFGIEDRSHHSLHDNLNNAYSVFETNPRATAFDETSYPIVITAWYAPTRKWSLSAGYAVYTNWIDQLITLGDQYNDGVYNPVARNYQEPQPAQDWWQYAGRAEIVSLGATYAWTRQVRLNGGIEWGRSRNGFASPPSPAISQDPAGGGSGTQVPDWTLLPSLSDVIVDTTRITAGVDYALRERIDLYFRYSLFDYDDEAGTGLGGTTHGFLGGLSAVF
jgi:hypothetical protein